MQNAAPAAQAPSVTITPSGAVQVTTQQPMRPLTNREISAIRGRRSDISSQLTSSMERRENLMNQLEDAPATVAPGLISQIQVLDQRIVKIEADMEASGQMLRTGMTVDNGIPLVGPREFGNGRFGPEEAAARGAAMGATVLVPIFLFYMIARLTRGRRQRKSQETQNSAQDARMERLEQAVDAIALEIERVGESQRYQTKVLAEANLMPAMAAARSGEPVRARDYDR